jgi:hypothetical protein
MADLLGELAAICNLSRRQAEETHSRGENGEAIAFPRHRHAAEK